MTWWERFMAWASGQSADKPADDPADAIPDLPDDRGEAVRLVSGALMLSGAKTLDDRHVSKFCNERVRPMADACQTCFRTMQHFNHDAAALGILASIPNDGTVILDGSETDGRTPLTGQQIHALITGVGRIVSTIETEEPVTALLVARAAVNGHPKF